MKSTTEKASQSLKQPGQWQKRCLILFLIGTVIVVVGMLIWSMSTSMPALSEKAGTFAAVMRIVRPIILLSVLVLWRPAFGWFHSRSLVSSSTAQRAVEIWPRLAIWVGLLELTIGQGFVLIGLAAIAGYWFFLRMKVEP